MSDALPSYLNEENIKRSKDGVEYHPLIPFLPENGKVLFLGSFPPQRKRWCMDFYYPNFINDHWRIQGIVFHQDKDFFVDTENKTFKLDAIVNHCKKYHIGYYDTATAVKRLKDNASDKFLEVVTPTDIPSLLSHIPDCYTLVATGQKATDVIVGTFACPEPPMGGKSELHIGSKTFYFWRMPSTSRAYPLALDKKAEAYRKLFSETSA